MNVILKNIGTFFLPTMALVFVPFVASLKLSAHWIGIEEQVLLVFFILSCGVSISLSAFTRVRLARAFFIIWIIIFTVYFFTHIPFIRHNIPHFQRVGLVVGILISAIALRKVKIETNKTVIIYLSAAFLVADLFELNQLDILRMPAHRPSAAAKQEKPVHIFHIVLDMFSFVHSMPANDRLGNFETLAMDFAKKHNLTFYKNHFSNAACTDKSVPNFMQTTRSQVVNEAFERHDENILFKAFADSGFKVSIHGQALPYCRRFSQYAHLCKSITNQEGLAKKLYQSVALHLAEISQALPPLLFHQPATEIIYRNPTSALEMVDTMISDLTGEFFAGVSTYSYLHILIPHDPFRVDENCNPIQNLSTDDTHPSFKGDQGLRFRAQARCTLKQLDKILNHIKQLGIYDDSKIMIHSDHGKLTASVIDAESLRATPFESAHVIEAGKIVAWSKSIAQANVEIVTDLTSNASVAEYLRHNQDLTLLVAKEVNFEFCPLPSQFKKLNKPLHYRSSDGTNWEPNHKP